MKIFLRILCILLSVVFAVGLFASAFTALILGSVRGTLTPAFVTDTVKDLDYASLRFPDGFGGFTTVPEQLNTVFSSYGFSVTDEGFNELCRDLTFDDILNDFLLGFRAWLLDDGPLPQIDVEKAAAGIASGINSELLSVFRDPAAFVSSLLGYFVNANALAVRVTALAPLREVLGAGTLRLVLSFVLTFALLLYFSCRTKLLPAMSVAGLAASLAGAAALFAPTFAVPYKNSLLRSLSMPESTFDILYRPLTGRLAWNGFAVMLAGAGVFALSLLLLSAQAAIRRNRAEQENATSAAEI